MQGHVEVGREDSREQRHEPPTGERARGARQDAQSAKHLEGPTEVDQRAGCGQVRRHNRHVDAGAKEMTRARRHEGSGEDEQADLFRAATGQAEKAHGSRFGPAGDDGRGVKVKNREPRGGRRRSGRADRLRSLLRPTPSVLPPGRNPPCEARRPLPPRRPGARKAVRRPRGRRCRRRKGPPPCSRQPLATGPSDSVIEPLL